MSGKTYSIMTDIINNGRYTEWAHESHEIWRKTKESQGWSYGPVRDDDKKTNPAMVPFEQLPANARGQNSLTPYAVVNFFRVYTASKSLSELDDILAALLDGSNPALLDRLGEYVHSHFLAAQLAKGDTINTRDDMLVYEALDDDTKSWDTQSALEIVKFLRQEIAK